MAPLYSFDNVCFTHSAKNNEEPLFEGFSLEMQPGEFLAIVGPSGSGKSTILSLMAGLKKPQSGSILFEGRSVPDLSSKELSVYLNKEVGMVFQFFNLITGISALDNVMMPAVIAQTNQKAAKKRALELLDHIGLKDKANSKTSKLSGGQQQRVAIARSFMNEPKVILADEPTGNLDRITSQKVMELLCAERKRRNCALVVVTHDSSIADMADTVLEIA